ETIVLKALEKRKEARYQSVAELCGDVERFLTGDPIQAKKASPMYLLRKLIARHRLQVAISAMAVVLLALAGVLFQTLRSNQQQQAVLVQKQESLARLEQDYRDLMAQQSAAQIETAMNELSTLGDGLDEGAVEMMQKLGAEVARNPNLLNIFKALLVDQMGDFPSTAAPASRPSDMASVEEPVEPTATDAVTPAASAPAEEGNAIRSALEDLMKAIDAGTRDPDADPEQTADDETDPSQQPQAEQGGSAELHSAPIITNVRGRVRKADGALARVNLFGLLAELASRR
ncbi:MAG: hypothetical protein V3T70_00975, partial [Phycisphaerae bacterium]